MQRLLLLGFCVMASLTVWAQYPNTPEGQATSKMFEISWDPKGKGLVLSWLGKPTLKTKKSKDSRSSWKFHFVKEQSREEARWKQEEDRILLQPPKLDPPYQLQYEIKDEEQGVHNRGQLPVPAPK